VTKPSRAQRVWDSIAAQAEDLDVPVSVDVVCATAAARLPVTGVAVSVRAGLTVSEVVCATSSLGRDLEDLQLTLGEGPSLEVLAGSQALLLSDLDSADPQRRWPIFAGQALEAGARAFFALPMRVGAVRVGVLALNAQRPGPLVAECLAEAGVFAELALELLLDAQAGIIRGDGELPVDGLTGRPELHQATGMISVQLGVGMIEAMARLRARAFSDGRSLHELAADVVARRLRFEVEDPDERPWPR
jgi:ANTAR domain-containing protein